MVNTYGYNRKTQEEDEAILAAVKKHHDAVAAKGYLVVMTSLVGSQNYDLDHEGSDIDTYSLVFPPLGDLAKAADPESWMFELEDGHCNVKDIRVALNLLRKPSPNSVEYFASKYKVYNPIFESICHDYLSDGTCLSDQRLWYMIHCDYKHMLYAMAGMARQLTKRNMPAGKRFSHALRLDDMYYHFMNSYNAGAVLELRMGGDRDVALAAKLNTDNEKDLEYDEQTEQLAAKLERYRDEFKETEETKRMEERGMALIDTFQWRLFKKYLMETNV